ncbi:hypothetical protein DESC_290056 [Desulfosarcina cetonica]|nr:hypothetical protein DESC_290056 [Desulfosarcina cetonica]
MGHATILGLDRRFIGRIDNRAGAVSLVKPQACLVLLQLREVWAVCRIVGQALEEEAVHLECQGFLADTVIECATDPPAGTIRGRGDPVQVGEPQIGLVQQQRKSAHLALDAFGHEKNHAEALFEGVAQLLGDGIDLLGINGRELAAQNLLDLGEGAFIDRQNVVIDASNAEHGGFFLE